MRPEVVVVGAAAGAVDRRLDERNEINVPVAIEVVLGPIDLRVDLAQRFP